MMTEPPLPEFWTEEVDAKGRRFYSNHKTETTHWERPALPIKKERTPPPTYESVENASQPQFPGKRASLLCTPRSTYWIAVVLGCLPWAFTVWATFADTWFTSVPLSAVDEDVLDHCVDDSGYSVTSDFCDLYVSFVAMQVVAAVFISVACILLTLGFIRPAAGCSSTTALGFGGGCVLVSSAFLQLMALVLVIAIAKLADYTAYDFNATKGDFDYGITFWVAAVSFIFAMFEAGIILTFSASAGDGPFYAVTQTLLGPKP